MNIGILGSGNVGAALGAQWAKAGHKIVFAARDPQSASVQKAVAAAGANARSGTAAEASAASEILLVATPWAATEIAIAGAGDVTGKIIIDATNPLQDDLSGLIVGTTTSAGEKVQLLATGARVVKAFNTIGSNIMDDPSFGSEKALMMYCGDDAGAKEVVGQLATEIGFDALDLGPLTMARVLEPMALLWISLAYARGLGRDIAFKLMKR